MSSEMASAAVSGSDSAETAQLDTEMDDSLIPIFTSSSATEDGEGTEEDDNEDGAGEAGGNGASQQVSVTKRKNRGRGIMARGPTALPKNRGNGFEGTASQSLNTRKRLDAERQQSILRIHL